jgi:hypothetical protein
MNLWIIGGIVCLLLSAFFVFRGSYIISIRSRKAYEEFCRTRSHSSYDYTIKLPPVQYGLAFYFIVIGGLMLAAGALMLFLSLS